MSGAQTILYVRGRVACRCIEFDSGEQAHY
jgi:hypothetical protein